MFQKIIVQKNVGQKKDLSQKEFDLKQTYKKIWLKSLTKKTNFCQKQFSHEKYGKNVDLQTERFH